MQAPQTIRSFANAEEVAGQLTRNNPRLAPERAAWLASEWAQPGSDGQWHVLGDPAHKRVNPVPYQRDEALACWRAVAAPVLWVEGADTNVLRRWGNSYPRTELEVRLASIRQLERAVISDCGHMLHLDQPEALARVIEQFLS